ncbi:MAG TPA: aldo/keto reductase [Caldilineae bacterium]|jgi:aryl-alcohol dehydrogenase-like predicted oxidoreductase|nr:aldo/keto reductase [Caldilineae bacterium]
MFTRTLGRSGIEVSAMGLGCWAIGGPFYRDGKPVGWGQVDDNESIRAIHRALDLGVTFFDTADVYGCGHSERILGQALAGRRDKVVIATKFGNVFDEATRQIIGADASPEYIRRACEASLRRLNTDYIDLYQFHIGNYDLEKAPEVRDALEELVAKGKIRYYGWSTDDPERARIFAEGPHCVAIQQRLNIFEGNEETLAVCERYNLASINRGPLGMGLLTGKFTPDSTLPEDDVRRTRGWNFREGEVAERLKMLEKLRDILTRDGRTLAQAALGWLWARSEKTIPIPGFKTVQQVEENVGAMRFGPLSDEQMQAIQDLLSGSS